MTRKLIAWYTSLPIERRRFFIAFLVPLLEYLLLQPCLWILKSVAMRSPGFAILLLPVLLLMGVLTAAVISLFAYEFTVGIGNKIKNKAGGVVFGLMVLGWIFLPMYLINIIGFK